MKKTNLNISTSMCGHFKAEVLKDGEVVREYPWTENILTDNFFNSAFTNQQRFNNWFSLAVGDGTATPTAGDTALANEIARTDNIPSSSNSYQADVEPYYVFKEGTFLFDVGAAVGNFTEVGLYDASPTGLGTGPFISRALFEDEAGDPTTITVLAEEQLRVTYEVRSYFPVGDILATVDGYDLVIRPADIDNTNIGKGWGTLANVYVGTIGSVTSLPSGTAYRESSATSSSYTAGDLFRTVTLTWDTSTANNTLQSLSTEGLMRWQVGITPSITKTSNDLLTIEVTHSVSRGQPA